MSSATASPTRASLEPTLPAVPVSPPSVSPAHVDDIALKAANAGVKKPTQRKQSKRQIAQNAKANMQKLHAFIRAHRDEEKYKDMTYQEIQKAIGQLWKTAPENPKNNST
ncbi:hypothetical protein N0V86_002591 [Didymella sp. IMI 355093]|nr:hypothetical protein N0V86_002591 [Didymella sp. IMI 355093]